MIKCRLLKNLGSGILACALILALQTAWSNAPTDPFYTQGVESYRAERYAQAQDLFARFTQTHPEAPEGHYYWAISLVKLGKFKEARAAYENAIKIAPQSEAAQLANEGLRYLPQESGLDKPPQLTNAAATPTPANTATGGMDPEMLQTMMMMSSMGGGGGNSGFNPMMIPLMQSMTKGQGATPGAPTQGSSEMMRTMMMNQMLQNFSPMDMGKDD